MDGEWSEWEKPKSETWACFQLASHHGHRALAWTITVCMFNIDSASHSRLLIPNCQHRVGLNGPRSQSLPYFDTASNACQRREHPSLTFPEHLSRFVDSSPSAYPSVSRLWKFSTTIEVCAMSPRLSLTRVGNCNKFVPYGGIAVVLFASSWAINVKTYGIMTLHCLLLPASMFIQLFLHCFVLLCDEALCLSSLFCLRVELLSEHIFMALGAAFSALGNCGRIIDIRQQLMNATKSCLNYLTLSNE